MQNPHHFRVIKQATVTNALINTLLAIMKLFFGFVGQSQALFADGLHALSDVFSDLFVFFAAKAGQKKPDKEHPYGHQRIETLGAIAVALFLGVTGILIGYDAIHHALHHTASNTPSLWIALIALASAIANELLYHYTLNKSTQINSPILKTNAWHNRSDAMVSVMVLVAVLGSHLHIPYLDTIAAIIIAILIAKTAFSMIWQSLQELIDTGVDEKTLHLIQKTIHAVPGVVEIHQLRTRYLGGNIMIDVHIIVPPTVSVSEGHHISDEVCFSLLKQINNVIDVTVHVDPEDDEKNMPSLSLPNRETLMAELLPAWQHLPAFTDLTLHYLNGHIDAMLFFKQTDSIDPAAYQEAANTYRDNITIHCFSAL